MDAPRPVAGLPAPDPRAVARAWLVRRIADAPLEAAAGLAGTGFAERAPGLCAALVAALGDDVALRGLPGHAAVLRELAGPRAHPDPDGADTVAGCEHLRRAVLDALGPGADPALLAPLHDRLAHACAVLLGAALAAPAAYVVLDAREGTGERTVRHGAAPEAGPPTAPGASSAGPGPGRRDPRAHLTAEAARLVGSAVPFALLAVEVEDAAVLPAGLLAAAEGALHGALPTGALNAPDGPGSLLVLAREADGRALARTLTEAVAGAASHHGAPLRAAAGIAEHPRDGATPEGLLAHADGQLFAARADGLPLA